MMANKNIAQWYTDMNRHQQTGRYVNFEAPTDIDHKELEFVIEWMKLNMRVLKRMSRQRMFRKAVGEDFGLSKLEISRMTRLRDTVQPERDHG